MWIDDVLIAACKQPMAIKLWVPTENLVVMGSSNKAEVEVEVDRCETNRVPILKRYGGGGAVVLHKGCVIISIGLWVREAFANQKYFAAINKAIIASLADEWPVFCGIEQKGISDLAMGDFKIAGTSLFRSRHYLLYQASMLVDAFSDLMELYLRHPSKEPEYRCARSHSDFVRGLRDFDASAVVGDVMNALEKNLKAHLQTTLAEEIIDPVEDEIPHLLKRVERARVDSGVQV